MIWRTSQNDEENELRIELMRTQIDYYRSQMRWDVIKTLIAFLAVVAAFGGFVLALAVFLAPHIK